MGAEYVNPDWTFRESDPDARTGQEVAVTLRLLFQRDSADNVTSADIFVAGRPLVMQGSAMEIAALAIDHLDVVDDKKIRVELKPSDDELSQLPSPSDKAFTSEA